MKISNDSSQDFGEDNIMLHTLIGILIICLVGIFVIGPIFVEQVNELDMSCRIACEERGLEYQGMEIENAFFVCNFFCRCGDERFEACGVEEI